MWLNALLRDSSCSWKRLAAVSPEAPNLPPCLLQPQPQVMGDDREGGSVRFFLSRPPSLASWSFCRVNPFLYPSVSKNPSAKKKKKGKKKENVIRLQHGSIFGVVSGGTAEARGPHSISQNAEGLADLHGN